MANNQLQFGNKVIFLNGLPFTLPIASADPGSASTGDLYYNSATNTVRYYNGTAWAPIAAQLSGLPLSTHSLIIGDDSSGLSDAIDTSSVGQILAGSVAGLTIKNGVITNAMVANGAAIDYSKLNLLGQITGSDVSPGADIGYSQLAALTGGATGSILVQDGSARVSASTILSSNLFLADGTVQATGDFNLNSHKLTNVSAGSVATDGVNYGQTILRSGVNAWTGNQSLGGFIITNSGSPSNPLDLANKSYVDSLVQGLSWKEIARSATTGPLPANTYNNGTSGVGATLTGNANGALPAQDGVTLVVNDRLLVKNEATAANNGVYVVTAIGDASNPYVLTRATDADTNTKLQWATIEVGTEATTQAGAIFREANDLTTIGTDPVAFSQVSQGLSLVFTSGVQQSGNTVTANVDNSTIDVNGSNQLEIKAGGITNTQVSATAAIARTKLASGTNYAWVTNSSLGVMQDTSVTPSRAVITDINGLPSASVVTVTELSYVSGVTGPIQTQLNGKQAVGSYITALTGDVTASGPGSVASTVAAIQGITVAGVTGTGNVVFSISPTLSNPIVGTQTQGDNSTKAASTAYVDTAVGGIISSGTFSAANNQSVAANVTGLSFSNASVRSAKILVSVYVNATSSLYEAFEFLAIQRGADWRMSQVSVGDNSGFIFTITSAGQVQYTNSNYTGFTSATVNFKAYTTAA